VIRRDPQQHRAAVAALSLIFAGITGLSPASAAKIGSQSDQAKNLCVSLKLDVEQDIKELETAKAGTNDLASASNMVVFLQRLTGQSVPDPGETRKLEGLRHDIDRDVLTLHANGCDTREIDSQLPAKN